MTIDTLKIKIFADGADMAEMLAMNARPFIKGLTTNPTLMRRAGIANYRAFAREVLAQITDKPVSKEDLLKDDDLPEAYGAPASEDEAKPAKKAAKAKAEPVEEAKAEPAKAEAKPAKAAKAEPAKAEAKPEKAAKAEPAKAEAKPAKAAKADAPKAAKADAPKAKAAKPAKG